MNYQPSQGLQQFKNLVGIKFQLYNSLFTSLPFHRIEKTGILLSLLLTVCEEGYMKKQSPEEILEEFFRKQTALAGERERADTLFRFVQYVERQIVLFDALEDAATEFDVQGLELDWACLCWDANFRRSGKAWQALQFKGTRWQSVIDAARQRYVANSYRVLLTRARQGLIVFVPEGDTEDETRPPDAYDEIYRFLRKCGFQALRIG